MHFISFCSSFTRFAFYMLKEKKKEAEHAAAVIRSLEEAFGGTFDEPTRKKIIKSHSVFNPLVIDAFCSLHGRKSNTDERKRLIYYFTCSSLLDNFFDRNELTSEAIDQICFDSSSFIPVRFDEKAFIHCHRYLLDSIEDKAGYLRVLKAEVEAQKASMQQFQKDIPDAAIEAIMREKGGNAVLLCRYYLQLTASEDEDACWYQLGTIIQLSNDLFDIYKDLADGIETLANRCTNAYTMEAYVKDQLYKLQQMIAALSFERHRKQQLSIALAGALALARTGADNLKALQGNNAVLPVFNTLQRKQLIVDMEQWGNRMRWLKYVYHYSKVL